VKNIFLSLAGLCFYYVGTKNVFNSFNDRNYMIGNKTEKI